MDGERWAAFVARLHDHPAFLAVKAYEELSVRTPLPRQREALEAAGAPLTDTSLAVDLPRRGVLAI